MPTPFTIVDGNSVTYTDTQSADGFLIDFETLDNSFNITINGEPLFVGGPAGAENELQFQTPATQGQTVRFADGTEYENGIPAVWQLDNTGDAPVVRLIFNPDGTVELFGVKSNNGPLEPLELFNGLEVNPNIANFWNDPGTNEIVLDQSITGPTNANGEFEGILCFAAGTEIETDKGLVPVEDLQISDLIRTMDNGFQPIRWVGMRKLTQAELTLHPKLKPILIRADALGTGFPKRDLVVSPQHRILLSSPIALRMFGSKEVLVAAKKLLSIDGIEKIENSSDGVDYYHIMFDQHEIVWSNGTATESLFTGPEALKAVSKSAFAELRSLFPQIFETDYEPTAARPIPNKGKKVKKLLSRHKSNQKPFFNGISA